MSSFVLLVDKRENMGMHSLLSGNMVSNCGTTLYFRTNYHQQLYAAATQRHFHIWILNIMLDLIAFLSPQLITHWLGELVNTISVLRLNKKSYKEGGN